MMKTTEFSELSVYFYRTAGCHAEKDALFNKYDIFLWFLCQNHVGIMKLFLFVRPSVPVEL
jgi:hypothetical protein